MDTQGQEMAWDAILDGQDMEINPLPAQVEAGEPAPADNDRAAKIKALVKASTVTTRLYPFVDEIKNTRDPPCVKTGFTQLDRVLDGGLYPGLIIVGAISSAGKTTFCLQITDNIAKSKRHVLIFSLEMAADELMSKSISRHTLEAVLRGEANGDMANAKTARGITASHRYRYYSRTEKTLIENSIREYYQYAGYIHIVEGTGDVTVEKIRKITQLFKETLGEAPVVLVDYLQIIAPHDYHATDKQNADKAVMELKRLSRDLKTPVIAISSFNRGGYNAKAQMGSFKESGGIEYSADVALGLQFEGAGKKNPKGQEEAVDENAEKRKDPRTMELAILKQRNGPVGVNLPYNYYTKFNFFVETKVKENKLPENTNPTLGPAETPADYDPNEHPLQGLTLDLIKANYKPPKPKATKPSTDTDDTPPIR